MQKSSWKGSLVLYCFPGVHAVGQLSALWRMKRLGRQVFCPLVCGASCALSLQRWELKSQYSKGWWQNFSIPTPNPHTLYPQHTPHIPTPSHILHSPYAPHPHPHSPFSLMNSQWKVLLVAFLFAMTKYLTKVTEAGKGLFQLTIWRYGPKTWWHKPAASGHIESMFREQWGEC